MVIGIDMLMITFNTLLVRAFAMAINAGDFWVKLEDAINAFRENTMYSI